MGTLKTTLKVESTDLFPTPVSFTVVNNNGVNGNFNGFNTLTVTSASHKLNVAAINGTGQTAGAYLYAQAPSTNQFAVCIGYTGQTGAGTTDGSFVFLSPGDVAFVPVGGSIVGTINDVYAYTTSLAATGTIYYFLGEK